MKSLLVMAIAGMLALTACTDNVSRLIKNAEKGDPVAQMEYGRLLQTKGNGVEQDWPKAVEMLQLASDNGNADAMWELGLLYEHANHVAQDHDKAFSLFKRSADAGNLMGLYLVAHCYQHGIGVEENHAISDELYTQAVSALLELAPQEDRYVLNFVGSAFYWGDGVKVDRKRAFEYYLTSARKGNPETQCKIGGCYENGQGTAKDMTEALYWYRRSADQGFADAIAALERLQAAE